MNSQIFFLEMLELSERPGQPGNHNTSTTQVCDLVNQGITQHKPANNSVFVIFNMAINDGRMSESLETILKCNCCVRGVVLFMLSVWLSRRLAAVRGECCFCH